jgi:hypothetical protein
VAWFGRGDAADTGGGGIPGGLPWPGVIPPFYIPPRIENTGGGGSPRPPRTPPPPTPFEPYTPGAPPGPYAPPPTPDTITPPPGPPPLDELPGDVYHPDIGGEGPRPPSPDGSDGADNRVFRPELFDPPLLPPAGGGGFSTFVARDPGYWPDMDDVLDAQMGPIFREIFRRALPKVLPRRNLPPRRTQPVPQRRRYGLPGRTRPRPQPPRPVRPLPRRPNIPENVPDWTSPFPEIRVPRVPLPSPVPVPPRAPAPRPSMPSPPSSPLPPSPRPQIPRPTMPAPRMPAPSPGPQRAPRGPQTGRTSPIPRPIHGWPAVAAAGVLQVLLNLRRRDRWMPSWRTLDVPSALPTPSPMPDAQPMPFVPIPSPSPLPTPSPTPSPSPSPLPSPTPTPSPAPWPTPLTPLNAAQLALNSRTDECECRDPEGREPNPSNVVASVRSFARRMSQNSLDNLRKG